MPYANSEKRKEYRRRYYQDNKKRLNEQFKQRLDNDPELKERTKQYQKEYYQKNKEKYSSSWDKIKSDPIKHEEHKEKNRINKKGAKSYRITRKKILEHLGNQCVMCGATEKLEINHKNLADTELRRLSNKNNNCKPGLNAIRNNEVEVDLLCHDCHQKWSCAQRKAAMKLFASQSMEEQIKLTQEFFH